LGGSVISLPGKIIKSPAVLVVLFCALAEKNDENKRAIKKYFFIRGLFT
jgi:hypothetical protein